MRKNKKGIELSINFLVVIILSIVMLGMGVMLIRNFYDSSMQTVKTISEKEEIQINSMLNRGEKVAMPINIKTIPRGELNVFGLGIFNVLERGEDFELEIVNQVGVDSNNEEIEEFEDTGKDKHVKVIMETEEFYLEPNEHRIVNMFIQVGKRAEKGTYTFTARVRYRGNQQYGLPVKFTVIVP